MRFHLKRQILFRYGTQANFAAACKRNENWISRLIQGRQTPTEEEKKLILEKLEMKDDGLIFMDFKESF